jgi:signal transduction histidine kinase
MTSALVGIFVIAFRILIEPALEANLHVRIAPGELKTVVSNLVMNAIEHRGHGAKVLVAAQALDSRVVINIRDFGTGISAESIPHVLIASFAKTAHDRAKPGARGWAYRYAKQSLKRLEAVSRLKVKRTGEPSYNGSARFCG